MKQEDDSLYNNQKNLRGRGRALRGEETRGCLSLCALHLAILV